MQRKQLNDSPWVAQAGLKTSFCSPASLPPVQALPSAFQQGQPPGNTLLSEPSPPPSHPAAQPLLLRLWVAQEGARHHTGSAEPTLQQPWSSGAPATLTQPAQNHCGQLQEGQQSFKPSRVSLKPFFTPSFPSLPQCECSYLWSPNIVLARQHAALTCWGPVEFWIKQRAREGIPRGASQRDTPQLAAYQQVQSVTWERQVQVTQGGTLPGMTRC